MQAYIIEVSSDLTHMKSWGKRKKKKSGLTGQIFWKFIVSGWTGFHFGLFWWIVKTSWRYKLRWKVYLVSIGTTLGYILQICAWNVYIHVKEISDKLNQKVGWNNENHAQWILWIAQKTSVIQPISSLKLSFKKNDC